MYSMLVLAWAFGYGMGFEGYDKGKVFVGIYTPKTEYGWVISNQSVYLDTIFEKRS